MPKVCAFLTTFIPGIHIFQINTTLNYICNKFSHSGFDDTSSEHIYDITFGLKIQLDDTIKE